MFNEMQPKLHWTLRVHLSDCTEKAWAPGEADLRNTTVGYDW